MEEDFSTNSYADLYVPEEVIITFFESCSWVNTENDILWCWIVLYDYDCIIDICKIMS